MRDKGVILRFGRIKSRKQLLSAFMHNKREFINPDSNINLSKICDNFPLDDLKSSAECMSQFEKKLQDSDIKTLRSNAVLAVEVLISISTHLSEENLKHFFKDSTSWIKNYFGVPILSIDVHLDESNPHLHAILLPVLVIGKLNGHKLIGNISNMRLAQKSLYETVGKKFGLSNWAGDKKNKQELIHKVLERLKEDAAIKSAAWPVILKAIKTNPHHFLGVLS